MALTPDQAHAFTSWLESNGARYFGPDRHSGANAFSLAWAAFEEGLRVADNADSIRYDAQYRRRFLPGGERSVSAGTADVRVVADLADLSHDLADPPLTPI